MIHGGGGGGKCAAVQQQIANPANQAAADAVKKGAWGALASLLLGLGAAALGGTLGARRQEDGPTGMRGTTA